MFDGNHRRKTADLIDIWPFQVADELAGIDGKCFHVAPLPFRIYRIKRQRRFAAAAQPGDHHQLIPGNGYVDILQIMHPRTEYINVLSADNIISFLNLILLPEHAFEKNLQNYGFLRRQKTEDRRQNIEVRI